MRLLFWTYVFVFCLQQMLGGAEIVVEASQTNGRLRPLHGVNLGPLCYRGTVDLSAYHRELGVPLTRLHDVVWLNADAVDISTIFRDWRNDPENPAGYDFRTTDDYIQSILNVGSQIVYRLGESIEHTPRKYRVAPPPEPEKWARICLGVVRHYNDGWANGFRHNIRYWEIWNEPDIGPAMWNGTEEQYFRLYEAAAKAVKARFPELKVGGPALGNPVNSSNDQFQAAPFFAHFLEYCRTHEAPLDFCSWHRYTADPWDLPRRAAAVRRVLDEHGFTKTESHLNEWNYLPREDWRPLVKEGQGVMRREWFEEMGGPAGAAFAASALLLVQDAPLDAANFYTGEVQGFGLFDFYGVPKKSFYAFKAFRRLLDTPVRLTVRGEQPGSLAACAGINADRSELGILIANFRSADDRLNLLVTGLPWDGPAESKLYAVDAAHDLVKIKDFQMPAGERRLSEPLKAPSVLLLKLRRPNR